MTVTLLVVSRFGGRYRSPAGATHPRTSGSVPPATGILLWSDGITIRYSGVAQLHTERSSAMAGSRLSALVWCSGEWDRAYSPRTDGAQPRAVEPL